MIYRLIGRSQTFSELGFQTVDGFDQHALERKMKKIRDVRKQPPFSSAYIVSPYLKMGSRDKIENVARLVARLSRRFDSLYRRICISTSAEEAYNNLRKEYGFGRFLAYQVLVDLMYPIRTGRSRPLLPFSHDDWAEAGPGARKGIEILLRSGCKTGDPDVMRWLRLNQRQEFRRLHLDFKYLVDSRGNEVEISLSNIENCLCEFYKYSKIDQGVGRARRRFAQPGDASGD